MKIEHRYEYSEGIIELFQGGKYEQFILSIMNKSNKVFPNQYKYVEDQSHGECDFLNTETQEKYDAKLPFLPSHVKLLSNGKKYAPRIKEWLTVLLNESSEFFNEVSVNGSKYDVSNTKLYKIMEDKIKNDKIDENIIFFFPFPIVDSVKGSVFQQFATDYLVAIYNKLNDKNILKKRKIFAIYPSSERNTFAVRNLANYILEFVECAELGEYFSHEISGVSF